MIITPGAKAQPHDKADYRFRRGSKLADFPPVHPEAAVPPLSSFDGPFQLAEYLSLKVRTDPHDIKALVDVPADNAKAADKHVWIYEHLRRIPIDATPLITQLLQMCSRESCPEMKADEWQYLCVAHGGEGTDRCCAIDYILHAVDSTTALLNSSNYFPSRLQIPHASLAHFPSLFRRLSRIFSHAYFHHREAFATAEAETSLYARFVALCEKYELVSSNLLIIPQSGYEVTVMREDEQDDEGEVSLDSDEEEAGEVEEKGQEESTAQAQSEKAASDADAEAPPAAEEDRAFTSPPPDGATSPREDLIRSTHSLGRYQSPSKWATSPVQPATKGKPAPAHTSESLSPPSTRASLEYEHDKAASASTASSAPSTPGGSAAQPQQSTSTLAPSKSGKRGTLSRGKAPRAANVWSDKAEDEPPLPANADETIGMARKESVDSVVYVGKDGDEEDGSGEDKAAVPSAEGSSVKPAASPKPTSTEPLSIPSPSASQRKPASPPAPLSPPKSTPQLALSPKSVLATFPDRSPASPSPKATTGSSTAPKPAAPVSNADAAAEPEPVAEAEEDDAASTSPTPSPAPSPLTTTGVLASSPESPTKLSASASVATSTALAAPTSPLPDSDAAPDAEPSSASAEGTATAETEMETALAPEADVTPSESAAPAPAPAAAQSASKAADSAPVQTPSTAATSTPVTPATPTPATPTPATSTPTPATPAQSQLGTSPRSELQARPDRPQGEQLAVSRGSGRRGGQGRKSRVPRSPGKKGRKESAAGDEAAQ